MACVIGATQLLTSRPKERSSSNLRDGKKTKPVSLPEIVRGMRERGMQLPVLIRFGDLLRGRIEELCEGFATAIREGNYRGVYRGVYPDQGQPAAGGHRGGDRVMGKNIITVWRLAASRS